MNISRTTETAAEHSLGEIAEIAVAYDFEKCTFEIAVALGLALRDNWSEENLIQQAALVVEYVANFDPFFHGIPMPEPFGVPDIFPTARSVH